MEQFLISEVGNRLAFQKGNKESDGNLGRKRERSEKRETKGNYQMSKVLQLSNEAMRFATQNKRERKDRAFIKYYDIADFEVLDDLIELLGDRHKEYENEYLLKVLDFSSMNVTSALEYLQNPKEFDCSTVLIKTDIFSYQKILF